MKLGIAALAAALALAPATPAPAVEVAGVKLPQTLRVGAERLVPVSCGVRDTLWIEHYAAALYLQRGVPLSAVRDAKRPAAVMLRMIDTRYMPESIPQKWLEALERTVAPSPLARLRTAYRRLADGDRVLIEYQPRRGVTMRVNGRTVIRAPGHSAVRAILDAWAGRDDISGKLARLRLEHPCPRVAR